MMDRIICGLTKFFIGINVRGNGSLCDDKQRIYFVNHQSHFDFLVLWSIFPPLTRRRIKPVAAKDFWEKNWFRRYLIHDVAKGIIVERTHHFPFDHPQHPVHVILKALEDGSSIIIFPEGTRSTEGGICPFKAGLYHIAQQRPDIPLVPVYLENLNRILPKGEILPVPLISSITFGHPLLINLNEDKELFLQRARKAIEELEAL